MTLLLVGRFTFVRRVLLMAARAMVVWEDHNGIRIGAIVPQGMDEALCKKRIKFALDLLDGLTPYRTSRMRRDVREVLCVPTGRNRALGAYVPIFRSCLIDPWHVLDPETGPLDLAKTIVHESIHARLHHGGIGRAGLSSTRAEAICRRAETDLERKFARTAEAQRLEY